jgi:hypothetical protein
MKFQRFFGESSVLLESLDLLSFCRVQFLFIVTLVWRETLEVMLFLQRILSLQSIKRVKKEHVREMHRKLPGNQFFTWFQVTLYWIYSSLRLIWKWLSRNTMYLNTWISLYSATVLLDYRRSDVVHFSSYGLQKNSGKVERKSCSSFVIFRRHCQSLECVWRCVLLSRRRDSSFYKHTVSLT